MAYTHYIAIITVSMTLLMTYTVPTYRDRHILLTPDKYNQDGASIHIINIDKVTINEVKNQWEIITESNEWFMKLHLNESWGFNKHFGSTIAISFDSPTIGGTQTFDELIVGVTVPNSNKYIVLNLIWNSTNRIIPQCDTSTFPETLMEKGTLSDLYKSYTSGPYMLPETDVDNQITNGFPMNINLTNYPKFSLSYGHYAYIQFSCDAFSSDFIQQCGFEPFDTEHGLDIYLGITVPWNEEKMIAFKSFGVQYTDQQTLFSPTNKPINPSDTPTNIPTVQLTEKSNQSTDSLWTKYTGVWIVCLVALMTCITGIILLYFSRYDRKSKQKHKSTNSNKICRQTSNSCDNAEAQQFIKHSGSISNISMQSSREGCIKFGDKTIQQTRN